MDIFSLTGDPVESFVLYFSAKEIQFAVFFILIVILTWIGVALFNNREPALHVVEQRPNRLLMKPSKNPFFCDVLISGSDANGMQCILSCDYKCHAIGCWNVPIFNLCHLLNLDWSMFYTELTASNLRGSFLKSCAATSSLLLLEPDEKRHVYFGRPSCVPMLTGAPFGTIYAFIVIMFVATEEDRLRSDMSALVPVFYICNPSSHSSAQIIAEYIRLRSGQVGVIQKMYESSSETEVIDGVSCSLCIICYLKPVVVISPCSHACICASCLVSCERCPMCRGHIYDWFAI